MPFAILICVLFIGASLYEFIGGHPAKGLFYLGSAFLNYIVLFLK